VEDEHAVRELTRRILCRHRHEVLTAGSPSEALHVLANHEWPVDLLVTDVVLPEMSGKELAERMRELQPGLPVLYVSGYDDEIVARHGVLESHTPLLQKPFDTHALLARVREALDGPAGSKPITQ
jgi:DNA-binding response OmpR family regulator